MKIDQQRRVFLINVVLKQNKVQSDLVSASSLSSKSCATYVCKLLGYSKIVYILGRIPNCYAGLEDLAYRKTSKILPMRGYYTVGKH